MPYFLCTLYAAALPGCLSPNSSEHPCGLLGTLLPPPLCHWSLPPDGWAVATFGVAWMRWWMPLSGCLEPEHRSAVRRWLIFPNGAVCGKPGFGPRVFISLDQSLHYLTLGNRLFGIKLRIGAFGANANCMKSRKGKGKKGGTPVVGSHRAE